MEAQLMDLARSAGATVVTLMATEAWERARDGLSAVWRRVSPARADTVEGELEATREELLRARQSGDETAVQELGDEWAGRLRRLLREHPEAADDLRQIIADLAPTTPQAPSAVQMRARASGSGRVYQAGRDQHITER
ncbi:hypothetical protein ACIHAA_10620 [Streptomyces sp. NPDC052040]|uniref:hypothetical protein n=1 Tax=Streptomyces sp. NPDC052040 TaxID=3365682 RepID=UPI0037CF97B7